MKKNIISSLTLAGAIAVLVVSYKYFVNSVPKPVSLNYELPVEVKKISDKKQYFNVKQKEKISQLLFQPSTITKSTEAALSVQGTLSELHSDLERIKSEQPKEINEFIMALESYKLRFDLHETQITAVKDKSLEEAKEFLSDIKTDIQKIVAQAKVSNNLDLKQLNELLDRLPQPETNAGHRAAPVAKPSNDYPVKNTSLQNLSFLNQAYAALPFGCQTNYHANNSNENHLSASFLNINDSLVAPTTEILEVARKLTKAEAIFKFVRDNIHYYPTFGFTQSAKAVMDSKKGNPFDQSTLLISLLRSAGIPARYVIGEVWISTETLKRLWNIEDEQDIWSFYQAVQNKRFKDSINVNKEKIYRYVNGSRYYLVPHAWVETYTKPEKSTEEKWIQLDPSFVLHEENKKHELVNKVFDIASKLNINIFTYEDFFFQPDSTGKIIKKETADIFAARKINAVINYAQTSNYSWDKRLTSFFNKIEFDMNYISSFSYGPLGDEACILDKLALPTSKYIPKVKFGFEGTEHSVPMVDMAGKMVNIRYRGATSVDRSKLDLHAKGQYIGSLSDIKLIAQLHVDNKIIKESSTTVSFGPYINFTMDFVDTNGMWVPETNERGTTRGGVFAYNTSVLPESQAIFDREIQKFNEEIGKVSVQTLNYETKSRLVGTLLSTGTMRLKLDEEIHHKNISEMFNGKVLHPGLHYTFRSGFNPIVFNDRNYGFSPDIPILSIDGAWTAWGNHPSAEMMGDVAFAFGSQQEHQIMENHFNVPGRSSVFILQYAKENGIPIVASNYDPNNIDSILGQLVGYGTSRIDFYRKEMLKGKAGYFYAPKYPVKIQDSTYYVIFSGGFNGGGAGALIGTEKGGAGGPASADTGIGYTTTEIGDWLSNNGSTIGRNSQQIPHIQKGEYVNGCAVGQPVNLNNGGMWHKFQDISPIGDGPGVKASFARTYLAKRSNDFSTLGYGWTHNLNLYLRTLNGSALDINQNQDIIFFDGDGNENLITFENNNFQILPFKNLSYKKENGNFILTDRDFNVMTFHGSGNLVGKIKEIKDRNANTLSFSYDLTTSHLMGVQDRIGRSINLTYQNGMLKKVSDFTGRSVFFTHDTNGDLTQSIDVLSNKTVYTYYNGLSPIELNHNLKSFKNEKGEGVEYFYYKNDKVFKHIEPEGKITTFLYDTYNKQTSVINGKEERTTYRYDIAGNILSVEQPDRSVKDYKYDLYRNKIYEKDENNFVTTYKSDNRGNITEIIPPAPFGKTIISYDPKYNVPNLVTNGKGNKTTYGIDPQNGNIRSIKQYPTTGKELHTQITYNEQGEITSIIDPKQNALTIERTQNTDKSKLITITNAEGGTMTRELDPLGQVVRATDLNGIETSLTYNNLGLPVSSSTPQASINQTFSYDKSNNLIGVAREVEGKTLTSSYIHDGLGNIIEATNERGETYKISYQQSGCGCAEESRPKQIIDPKGGVTKLEHDWRGNVIQKIDPMGIKTRLNYDPRGNLAAVTVFNTNESISSQINFTYGPLNLLKEKSEIVGYAIVLNRNTFKTSDPVKDMIVKTIYNFDPASNLSEKVVTRPATGEVAKTSYSYNGLNLLTGINSTGYKHNISKALSYDDASNLTQVTQNKTKLVIQYDGSNRPVMVQTIADTTGVVKQPSSTLNYTYTPGGQVTSIKDAVGAEIVGYELDELMRPRLVKSGKFSIGIEFDSLGRKKQISYPNKLETTFSFDNFERLAEISTPDLGFRSYDYDPLSNISQIKFESGQLDYAYDRNSSIIGSYYRGAEAIKDELFVWDASGNRLNGTQAPKTPSIRPRPIVINNGLFEDAEPLGEETVGRYSMIYDMHGNVTKKFDNQENIYYVFEYDADNKLVYAEKYKNDSLLLKARYTFDGLGRRIEKEVTKGSVVVRKSYVYNGDDILLEYNTSDSTPVETARYIGTGDIDDNLVAIKNGKPFFYHKDHLGSVVAITNDVGEIVQKNQYSSFGKILSIKDKNRKEIGIEGATEKSFAYTGREWDEEIDLYYYRARHYDPLAGRFIQKDPIGLNAGDTNLYRYVFNSPLNFIDPTGLQIDYAGYVLTNYNVTSALYMLNQAIIGAGYSDNSFTIRVTGGDRYTDSNGDIRSLTNRQLVSGASMQSPHLLERGARGIDFNLTGTNLSHDQVEQLMISVGFQPGDIKTPAFYPGAPHFHGSLPNIKSNYGPYSNLGEYMQTSGGGKCQTGL